MWILHNGLVVGHNTGSVHEARGGGLRRGQGLTGEPPLYVLAAGGHALRPLRTGREADLHFLDRHDVGVAEQGEELRPPTATAVPTPVE